MKLLYRTKGNSYLIIYTTIFPIFRLNFTLLFSNLFKYEIYMSSTCSFLTHRSQFKDKLSSLVFLPKSCLNASELERILTALQDELRQTGFCDLNDHLNYTLSQRDLECIFQLISKRLAEKSVECVLQGSLILSVRFRGLSYFHIQKYLKDL